MRLRSKIWLALAFLIAATLFWRLDHQRPASAPAPGPTTAAPATPPGALPSRGGLTRLQQGTATANATSAAPAASPYLLRNTTEPLAQLMRQDTAILLRNAWVDTRAGMVSVPKALRAQGDPGSYIVQSRGPIDDRFRAQLRAAGATVVSYIPNNAYLVRVSADGARQLAAAAPTQAVLPYEPYYKLDQRLLGPALNQQSLNADQWLKVTVFAGAEPATLAALQNKGAEVIAQERSPFGPVVTVRPGSGDLAALARISGVKEIEPYAPRVLLNDLTRVRLGVAADTVTTNNYLDLTGKGVLVNVNDSGVDASHPDLAGRVQAIDPAGLSDTNGHGTHVAGIIAGNGAQSSTVTNAIGSAPNASFQGEAPAARVFVLSADPALGPTNSDSYLQESAARANAPISNNSWGYQGVNTYDIAAASYDAAVRDALPKVTGSQPLLFVFAAGDGGGGTDDGLNGVADSLTSPGTAKNVITVGAIENFRGITNTFADTNTATFLGWTDSSNAVAAFSSRGNVGVGIEGPTGRFKPDVVAPGTFVVSTRSQQWGGMEDAVVMAQDPNATNDLAGLNQGLGTFYRYDSGTSMSAAAVTGVLALMREFLVQQGIQPSPALMKALLINGARGASPAYDFQTTAPINYQGWGLVNISNSLPSGLTAAATVAPLWYVDQSPAKALATGQTASWQVTVAPEAQGVPLHVTLVWTDPPGDPAAAIKLVNDLDLVVVNTDTGEIFFGNNFPPGSQLSQGGITNVVSTNLVSDIVNNVEQVILPPPLGTNYTVAVVARRVNVNSVNAHPNGVVQDFALVVGIDDPSVTNAVTVASTPTPPAAAQGLLAQPVIGVTNGLPLLNQRVGANSPLSGLPNGITNQWNFYVFTNSLTTNAATGETGFATNVAFVTFQPPNVSRPRNIEADLDLYASTNAALTNLDPVVMATAQRSVGRGGTEVVFYTNAAPDQVFYVGVKSEDQEGGEFGLIGLSSLQPFDQQDKNGTHTLVGNPTGLIIPEGSPDHPGEGVARAIAIATSPITVRRVRVADAIVHASFGDLIGNLSHNNRFVVLNNHTEVGLSPGVTNTFVYDDSGQGDQLGSQPFSRPSDGPGSLNGFIGDNGMGVWFFNVVDNALGGTGRVQNVTVVLDPTQSGPSAGVDGTILPGRTFFDVIDVPPSATNLLITLSQLNGPVDVYVRRGALPTTTAFDKKASIDPPQGSLSLGINDSPPLAAGRYFIMIVNPGGFVVNFHIVKQVQLGSGPVASATLASTDTPMAVRDDALIDSSIHVPDDREVVDVSVGVRIDHPRDSDLVLHLVSPAGQRILLVENRGGTRATNFGSGSVAAGFSYLTFTEDTNLAVGPIKFGVPPFFTTPPPSVFISGFESAPLGSAVAGRVVDGWAVLTNQVNVINAPVDTGLRALDLQNGTISRVLPTTKGATYALRFAYRAVHHAGREDVNLAQVIIHPDPNSQQIFYVQSSPAALQSWQRATFIFTATQDGTPIEVRATNIGTDILLDTFVLAFVGSDVNYLPEEPLSLLAGQRSQGDWTLEVQDDRAGAAGPPAPMLLGWKLQLAYAVTNFPAIPLTNGICYAGTSIGTAAQYFSVDVPRVTTIATNTLSGSGILVLLFNQNGLPTPNTPGNVVVSNNVPASPVTLVLTTNLPPPLLVPGQRYYLGVTNNAAPNETNYFTLCVNFDRTNYLNLIPLTNNVPVTNTIPARKPIALASAGVAAQPAALVYYDFPIPTNAYQAAFMLFPTNGDVDMVVSQARAVDNPLPTAPEPPKCGICPFFADYYSDFPGTIPERILIQTNFTIGGPPPLVPGIHYYVGVQNADTHPVTYIIVASTLTGPHNVIPLANNLPLDYSLSVDPGTNTYFQFTIDQTNAAVRFDLYNLTRNADLVVQTNGFFPDDAYNYYQRAPGSTLTPGEIIVTTNQFLPTLNGDWMLAVANRDTNTVNFTIRATLLTSNFTVIPLTNGISYTNTIGGQIPGTPIGLDYYQFTVSTNAGYVTFETFPRNGDVDLVVRQGPFLPTPSSFDYQSANTGTTNEFIRVGPGSQPVRLSPGDWFLGVYNRDTNAVTYAVRATEFVKNIIALTNGVPYTNTIAPSDLLDYYRYTVSPEADHVTFQLLSPTGPVNFFIRQGFPLPDPGLYDYTGTNQTLAQQVTVFTNSLPVPLGPGDWYIGVMNETAVPVTYAVVATEVVVSPVTNNIITPTLTITSNEVCLTWASIVGTNYYVEAKAALTDPVWTPVSPTIVATDTNTTFCLALPNTNHFFQVLVGISPLTPPTNNIITPSLVLSSNEVCLTWASLIGTNYYVEGKVALADPAWTPVSPTIIANSTTTTFCLSLPNSNRLFQVIVGISPVTPPTNNIIAPSLVLSSNEVCLTWPSLVGTNYYVEGKAALTDPAWAAVSPTITAAGTTSTYCLSLPNTNRFFVVVVGNSPLAPPVTTTNIDVAPVLDTAKNELCLTWVSLVGTNYFIEGKPSLDAPVWTAVSPTILAGSTTTTYCLSLTNTNHFFQVVAGMSPLLPPPPSTNLVLMPSLSLTNNEVCLAWTSLVGTNYVVQGVTGINSTNWVAVSPTIMATNTPTSYCVPLSNTNRFFRVLVVP